MKISEIAKNYPIMKMQGCGNDFVVMVDPNEQLTSEQAKRICDRHFGIGSDGLITVLSSRKPEAGYRMKFFNPDGTTAEMCGNGIRCFAKYLVDNKFVPDATREIPVDTDAGLRIPEMVSNTPAEALVRVNMGEPVLHNPEQVNSGLIERVTPELALCITYKKDEIVKGRLSGREFTFVSMGNPHAVIFTDNPVEDVKKYGLGIERCLKVFPQKTNVEFVKVNASDDLTMYVWERGAGETLACGTGACASLVASVLNGHSEDHARLHLLGGDLDISWEGKGNPVYMTGLARNVCKIDAESLDKYLLRE
jgi:diaminopimelate epimerase